MNNIRAINRLHTLLDAAVGIALIVLLFLVGFERHWYGLFAALLVNGTFADAALARYRQRRKFEAVLTRG